MGSSMVMSASLYQPEQRHTNVADPSLAGPRNLASMLCLLAGRRTPLLGHPLPREQLHQNASQHRLVLRRDGDSFRRTHVSGCPGDERRVCGIDRGSLRCIRDTYHGMFRV